MTTRFFYSDAVWCREQVAGLLPFIMLYSALWDIRRQHLGKYPLCSADTSAQPESPHSQQRGIMLLFWHFFKGIRIENWHFFWHYWKTFVVVKKSRHENIYFWFAFSKVDMRNIFAEVVFSKVDTDNNFCWNPFSKVDTMIRSLVMSLFARDSSFG